MVWVVSDLHYMSSDATDYGKAFDDFVSKCDGKVVRYLPEVLDALLEEAAAEKPDTLILTGDITMDGEEINHLELAKKLGQLQEQGIQVLVIPGNHDINNHHARVYFGEEAEWTEEVSPERFGEIYGDFGYGQAFSRDQASFSYLYALRENIWLMLLDTAQYVPENLVDGAVRPETYEWMESQLEAAREPGSLSWDITTFSRKAACSPPCASWKTAAMLSVFWSAIRCLSISADTFTCKG